LAKKLHCPQLLAMTCPWSAGAKSLAGDRYHL